MNAEANKVEESVSVREGDLFEPLRGERFDVIISNPPCMPVPKPWHSKEWSMRLAVDGGDDGADLYVPLLTSAPDFLNPSGKLYIPIPKWSNWRRIEHLLNAHYEWSKVEATLVPYWLTRYGDEFVEHIHRLLDSGVVEYDTFADGGLVAPVFLAEATPR
ncbi:MAG: hypothetical protein HKN82_02640 [Akkermansiaceae bacterium]|nr:hypothetical protein [Akkermansiaceae bacterium]